MSKKDFNNFRFSGLNARNDSNKYMTMNRVSEDETKIVINVGENHLLKTKFEYAFIIDSKHVVFIKDWQVNINYFKNEVLLTKDYFVVKQWGDFSENFDEVSEDKKTWDYFLGVAKTQQNEENKVKWQVAGMGMDLSRLA